MQRLGTITPQLQRQLQNFIFSCHYSPTFDREVRSRKQWASAYQETLSLPKCYSHHNLLIYITFVR